MWRFSLNGKAIFSLLEAAFSYVPTDLGTQPRVRALRVCALPLVLPEPGGHSLSPLSLPRQRC